MASKDLVKKEESKDRVTYEADRKFGETLSAEIKELATKESALPALPSPEVLQEVFEKNFEGITPTFEVVKVPTGGGLAWTLPGDGDEQEVKKELIGVILDHYACRAYWSVQYAGGTSPPDCSSLDARKGSRDRIEVNGKPAFGECGTCQYQAWGTGKDGRGQACKKMHRVFILLSDSDSIFPLLLPLPPTSAEGRYEGGLSTYLVKLAGKLKVFDSVKTKIKLIQDKNPDGIAYFKVQFWKV